MDLKTWFHPVSIAAGVDQLGVFRGNIYLSYHIIKNFNGKMLSAILQKGESKMMSEFKERKDVIGLGNQKGFSCLLSGRNNQKTYIMPDYIMLPKYTQKVFHCGVEERPLN